MIIYYHVKEIKKFPSGIEHLTLKNQVIDGEIQSVVCVAGIVRDIQQIQGNMWKSLFEMNCAHSYTVHMLVGNDVELSKQYQIKLWQEWRENREYTELDLKCAPFIILDESKDESMTRITNRIDKISRLRDYQRQLLRESFGNKLSLSSIVMLVDFDLFRLPMTTQLVQIVNKLQDHDFTHDAICSAGVTLGIDLRNQARGKELWYYDTFSTVLYPDTFVHPLRRRLFPSFYSGENPNLVRSEDQQFGNFTQADLMHYLVQEGIQSKTGKVRMRSCFGGLTVYKAWKYLDTRCQYTLSWGMIMHGDKSTIMKYASSKDERPCEHVVLHECMHRSLTYFDIALDPTLVTEWRKDSF